MPRAAIGLRLRERRRQLGVTQSELARRVGVSPSYVNLIERNKRGIAGRLLRDIAAELGLRLEELDGAAERRLMEELSEAAADPMFAATRPDPNQAAEVIARYPAWARAFVAAYRAYREQAQLAEALSDRLTHDPFLGDAVHRMLTNVSAIRSASEILASFEDIEPRQRARFHDILESESRRLSEVAESLAQFFDRAGRTAAPAAPGEEVEAIFLAHGNHFPALETAGAADAGAVAALTAELLDRPDAPPGEAVRRRLRAALEVYAADARAAPYDDFLAAAREAAFDLDALAGRFGVDFDLVARRATSLRRDGAAGPEAAYVKINAAGFALARRNLATLTMPRYGAGCPLWAVYRAFAAPGRTIRQLAEFPTGERFVFVARAEPVGPRAFDRPDQWRASLCALPEAEAAETVYAARPREAAEPVGPNCRVCARTACGHRAEDPVVGA